MHSPYQALRLGIDVGSTTAKVVVTEHDSGRVLFSRYMRHHAEQARTTARLLREVAHEFPDRSFRAAVCGSGARPIAEAIGAHYIQEVVANASAVRTLYPEARTAIELGGQDAKILFFHYDEAAERLITSDMRMNGSCAGGTGAFIDEIASLLQVDVEAYEALAAKGTSVYDISGRCGVFAKTDIQSVLNQGGLREDIALSSLHAIAKQTIGGLAQGLELKAPIIFEGGPLTFNPTLIRVFAERLNLGERDIILPEHPETIVARGATLAVDELFPLEPGEEDGISLVGAIRALEDGPAPTPREEQRAQRPYFASADERESWISRHALSALTPPAVEPGDTLRVYLGIDAGSTTSKFVLLDEEENVVDSFYSGNQGDPMRVVSRALFDMYQKYNAMGVTLEVLGLGTTGYGELMFHKAFGSDYHTVETVAHAEAAQAYAPGASFILDIGGQDMKAIWLSGDTVTNITLNEACSSGCGSFLENFADSLGIDVDDIADAAFRAEQPAELGSRCTVFMNSAIITEQKNGKSPDDIMAGLCRSIIENVFTKVVRISNVSALGDKVVVQGGTFKNDAVLRALEQYLGCEVIRAPYPGLMGGIGAALLAKRHVEREGYGARDGSRFIGFDALADFDYTLRDNVPCPHCGNRCSRTLIQFSSGTSWVTGNRCPKGEVADASAPVKASREAPDMFLRREALLMKDYDCTPVSGEKGVTIGLPRALEFWDSMPFWTTFFRALGFETKLSHKSSRPLYEQGIPFVASDTVCFPAKLSHGHVQDLVQQGVDRIFMPMVMEMPSESVNPESNYVCAVLKGYPLVIRNSDDPARRWDTVFDMPMFHWYHHGDRKRQIIQYAENTFGLTKKEIAAAYDQGEAALKSFRAQLVREGEEILAETRRSGGFAVVLAGRPYHNDPLVCHDLSRAFTKEGIAVLTADSLPGLGDVSLRYTRAEVTNNFHTRMLSSAMLAAKSPELEYVQIVSFGCGHDAILSDEITRIMRETSGKSPLVLKLDEGAAANSLGIRIQSFLNTAASRRAKAAEPELKPLGDAYPAKYYKTDWKNRTVLVPNVSVAFCKLLSAVLEKQGLKVEPLPLGGVPEIQLGKKYVHNDTCFPAQMVIGEALAVLQSGKYRRDEVAVGMAKYQGDCRLSHYPALLRRALDEAGYQDVPIMSTDPVDSKEMHPGLSLGAGFEIQALWAITIMDILEELRRQIRPYECVPGETNAVFDRSIDRIAAALSRGVGPAITEYRHAIDDFCKIEYNREKPRPRVFVTGEYLVTFHPGSNFHIEEYLEDNGMEVILPRMINVFRKDFIRQLHEMKDFHVHYPVGEAVFTHVGEKLFDFALNTLERSAKKHPLYSPCTPLPQLAEETDPIMNRAFTSGEGWLIPAEIREYAQEGVHSFVILQPFGCLPNHICGRGVMKRIKEEFPAIQILPLDIEPDTSFANIENRLQMLIMNEKSRVAAFQAAATTAGPRQGDRREDRARKVYVRARS